MALATFVQGLGVENGRLMGEFPRTWVREAYEHLSQVDSVREQTRITELLKRIRTDGLLKVRLGLPYDGSRTWLDNASHHIDSFDAAIFADTSTDRPPSERLHPASSLLQDPAYWRVERRIAFIAKRDNYIALLRPLLKLTTRVAIMDPYFKPTNDHYVNGFLSIASALQPNTTLVIHTSTKTGKHDRQIPAAEWAEACHARLKDHADGLAHLTVVRWDQKGPMGHPHERWVITPRGGVELGKGIALGPGENTATLLPAETAQRLWTGYGEAPFQETMYTIKDRVDIR